ncbi:Protein of unknown function [Pyronema omphalodes CBS 100304]|uniref:Uncharacterized protein n=1 Tax=Pyronema omphalodes (strain CBS 100304) TaxID=1076935 RepID=U4L951_PYROM|nr:Protein of unknown function [Pyronema omphalodes CBS 100304]
MLTNIRIEAHIDDVLDNDAVLAAWDSDIQNKIRSTLKFKACGIERVHAAAEEQPVAFPMVNMETCNNRQPITFFRAGLSGFSKF